MIKILDIDHLNISTTKYTETLNFYKDHFGFETKEVGVYHGKEYQIIGIPNTLYLAIYQTDHVNEQARVNHVGFHVKNYDQTHEYCVNHNIKITQDTFQYPLSRSFYIEDPNGLEIEIAEKFAGGLN